MPQPTPLAYLNGRYLPQTEARLTLHDAGFVWGATVTDLCRTFAGRPYRLDDHLRRFRRSCEIARVPLAATDEELAGIADHLTSHNAALLPPSPPAPLPRGERGDLPSPLSPRGRGAGGEGADLAVVFFATPGPVGYYLGEPGGAGDGPPTLGVHTFPLPFARYHRLMRDGAVLVTPAVRHVPADCIDPHVKQRSRLSWWVAEQEARAREAGASALLLDADGCVTETAAANFLIVRGGAVLSPPRDSVLNGVSLQVVEELCRDLGIPFVEQRLTVADCRSADEAMLACTSFCLAGVRRVAGADLPWPGPVRRRLLYEWSRRVGIDIERQILSNP